MEEDMLRNIIREEIRANNSILEEKIAYFTNVLPFATYVGNDTVLTKSYFNVMYLVSSHDSLVAPHLIKNGVFESELTKYFLNNIGSDSVFVDIGANFGYYTCLAAKKITTGKVFAFEPNPAAFHLLQRNMLINWIDCPVKIEQTAVSNKKGEVSFKSYKYKFGMSQFALPQDQKEEGEINAHEITTVPTLSLDEYFPEDQKIDFLKIDVEGVEYSVLKGAERIIDHNPAIQILLEWGIPQLIAHGDSPNELLDFFIRRKFKPFQLDWRDGSAAEVSYDFLRNTEYLCAVLFKK